MSDKHLIKLTESEAVVKCYSTVSTGGSIDITLMPDLTSSTQVYNAGISGVTIKSMYWGTKPGKSIHIHRLVSGVAHGHYYLDGSGYYEFKGFVDNTYQTYDLRIDFEGEFHCILVLAKHGWSSKIETAEFSVYDNVNTVGS